MSIYTDISEALQKGRAKIVKQLIEQALAEGMQPQDIIENALLDGMGIVGEKFKNNEVFVPEVLIAARAMNAGMDLLKGHMSADGMETKGAAVIGTVKGDLHDIGKNLVKIMMEGKGLRVIDLGVDVSAEKFVETAIAEKATCICCSALLTTTMGEMKAVVDLLNEKGVREQFKVMVGGAPVTQSFCDSIGADCYTADAASASDAALAFCQA